MLGTYYSLSYFSINGNDTCTELLLESQDSSIANMKDCQGRTPVHAAAYNDHLESMQVSGGSN